MTFENRVAKTYGLTFGDPKTPLIDALSREASLHTTGCNEGVEICGYDCDMVALTADYVSDVPEPLPADDYVVIGNSIALTDHGEAVMTFLQGLKRLDEVEG